LQIDTDLLLIITSTADELSSGTNLDDLELDPKLVQDDKFGCRACVNVMHAGQER